MVQIEGEYEQISSENLDEYFKAIGVPFALRKLVGLSKPRMEFTKLGESEWKVVTHIMMKTITAQFKLGEEYDETMAGVDNIRSTTIQEGDNKFITKSASKDGLKLTRILEFDDAGCTVTLIHDESGTQGKRIYKRS